MKFRAVLGEVVEFPGRLGGSDEFPVTRPDGLPLGMGPVQGLMRLAVPGPAVDHGEKGTALQGEWFLLECRDGGRLEQGRQEVDRRADLAG